MNLAEVVDYRTILTCVSNVDRIEKEAKRKRQSRQTQHIRRNVSLAVADTSILHTLTHKHTHQHPKTLSNSFELVFLCKCLASYTKADGYVNASHSLSLSPSLFLLLSLFNEMSMVVI